MIRVTIELVPQGDESRAEVLERVEIWQTTKLDNARGGLRRYAGKRADVPPFVEEPQVVHHRRDQGAARLVARVLERLPVRWEGS